MTRRPILVSAVFALLGAVGLVVGLLVDRQATAFAYLFAFAYGLSLALGALLLLVIEHLSAARWFVALRRLTEAGAATMPVLVVLALPLIYFGHDLYPWTQGIEPTEPSRAIAASHKAMWLAPGFVLARSAIYFAIWILFSELLFRTSLRQGEDVPRMTHRLKVLASGSIWPLALTLTFAAFDWFMSLDPDWASTVYGIAFFAASVTAALSALVLVTRIAEKSGALEAPISSEHYYALGRLQLTFLILWAYSTFVQLLIIWMGDLPDEAVYYLARFDPRWRPLGIFLIAGGFFVPFVLLLQYRLKLSRSLMTLVSGWILVGHFADVAVSILPSGSDRGARLHAIDVAALAFVVGVMFAFGAWRLRGRPLVPDRDPRLDLSLRYQSP